MCFIDTASIHQLSGGVSRRQFLGAGFTAGVAATAVDWTNSLLRAHNAASVVEEAHKKVRTGNHGIDWSVTTQR